VTRQQHSVKCASIDLTLYQCGQQQQQQQQQQIMACMAH